MTPTKVINKLFEARDTIHICHLQTTSFAEHKALNEFYDEWLELADTFIETYFGKYGRVNTTLSIDVNSAASSTIYLKELAIFVNVDMPTILDATDSDLANIMADMKGLINHTLYLLTLK